MRKRNLSSYNKRSKIDNEHCLRFAKLCYKFKSIAFFVPLIILIWSASFYYSDDELLNILAVGGSSGKSYYDNNNNDDDAFRFINATTTLHIQNHHKNNVSCVLVGCHTLDAPGYEPYTNFYVNNSTYPVRITSFTKLQHHNRDATPHWCRIPSVLETLRSFPKGTRVVYIDLDTRTDPDIWCNMPLLSKDYMIMNSVHQRPREEAPGEYFVQGTQVQTNVFVVSAEPPMKRWEALYVPNITLHDQGVIHKEERGHICGVPGWIACHNNPIENRCHCTGKASFRGKNVCIKNMFEAPTCPNRNAASKLINTGEFA